MRHILLLSTNSDDAKVFLWCMREAGFTSFVIGPKLKNIELRYHPLIKKFYSIDTQWSSSDNFGDLLLSIRKIIKSEHIDIILPTGFESIKFLSTTAYLLRKFVPVIPIPTLEKIDLLGNKLSFAKFCYSHAIPHPRAILLKDLKQFDDVTKKIDFPAVTKPLNMSSGKGVRVFKREDDLHIYLSNVQADGSNTLPLLLQEFFPGNDIDFNGFANNGKLIAWTIQRFINILRKNQEPLRWYQFVRNDQVLEISKNIIKKSKYSGPIHIDLRINPSTNDVVSIEVNPRFWASTFYSLCDGVNFPAVAIQHTFDNDFTKSPLCSNRIWGSPNRLPFLLLNHHESKRQILRYASLHTILQVKYEILNRLFDILERLFKRVIK